MQKVKAYSTQVCPFCVRVKEFFRSRGIDFEEVDLTGDRQALRDLVAKTGWRTVPQVFIGDQFVGGCDDVLKLDREGKLLDLLRGL